MQCFCICWPLGVCLLAHNDDWVADVIFCLVAPHELLPDLLCVFFRDDRRIDAESSLFEKGSVNKFV